MKNLIMAWRNLWRNKRRTLITVASIFFGVVLSTLMSSLQEGTYNNMIELSVKFHSGYLQIQHPEYHEQKTINHTFIPTDSLRDILSETKGIRQFSPRLESFALLSSGEQTKGGAVIGIEPHTYDSITNLSHWVTEGKYLTSNSDGILLTKNLAKHLELSVNDTLVLLSQGYHGVTAAGKYPINGILTFKTPQLNNMGVFLPLKQAQELYLAHNRISAMVIMAEENREVPNIQHHLKQKLGDTYNILNWKEIQPELVQFIESDRSSGLIMKGILYMVIAFGILGTIIMMIAERRREIGVMIAVGMQRFKLASILFFETLFIGIIGVLSGFLVSIPIIWSLVNNPIPLPAELGDIYVQYGFEPYFFFSLAPWVFTNQALTVLILTLLIATYPVITIHRIKVTNALRA